LRPTLKPVVNPIYAKYTTSNYTVKKITCYSDKSKKVSEIRTGSCLYKVGEKYQMYSYDYVFIFATMKGLHAEYQYLNNIYEIQDIKNGCLITYLQNGSISSKTYYKNYVGYKGITFNPHEIFKTNYKKNKTTFYKYNNNKCNFTVSFVVWVSHENPKQYDRKEIFAKSQVLILSIIYDENGNVKRKNRYTNKFSNEYSYEGILFDSEYENKCGVFWCGRYVSKNIQKWYQTPFNFIFRKNKKIKCF
jgi:hypothetical protein